jgi:hypothetical protein
MAMTAVKEQEFVTCHVRVDRITLGTMPRPVDPQTVAILKETITTLGLLHPPTVKKGEHDTFELLAGYHRFQAMKELGWTEIPVHVVAYDEDLKHEWAMIQENLSRKDLTVLDLAYALGRSKEIYEDLHPESRHGKQTKDGPKVESFLDYEANAHSRSRASIGNYVFIYQHLCPTVFEQLRTCKRHELRNIEKLIDSLKDLHDLASKSSELQEKVVKCLLGTGMSYSTINSPTISKLFGLQENTQEPQRVAQHHGEPEEATQEQDETEKAYGIMDVYTLEAKEPTEAEPDPDPMVYAAQHVGNEHIYVKPGTRIRVKEDMVVVTLLKSDPYHLLIYEVEDETADDAVEEYRDLQISFYRSKKMDEV